LTKNEIGQFAIQVVKKSMPAEVIRGMDSHAHQGGDFDIIVQPGMALHACNLVAVAAQDQGLSIISFRDIGYVSSIVLLSINGVAVKLDFVNGFSWYGMWSNKSIANPFGDRWAKFHKNWTDTKIFGLLTFYQKIMASGAIKSKDWERIRAFGVDSDYLADFASYLRLPINLENIRVLKINTFSKWRLRAASCGVDNIFKAFFWFLRVCLAHAKFKIGFGTGKGIIVGISGMDGSGKTTLVDRLINAYITAGIEPPLLVHLLPSWIPLPHQVFHRKKTSQNYTRPYSEPPVSSKLSGWIRLAYYVCAFALTRIWLFFASLRGKQIILDRSFLDFASDLTRARIPQRYLPAWLMKLASPCGKLFYLDASPDVVVARKRELTLEKATSLQVSYLATAATLGAKVLDADNNDDVVFSELLNHISQEYMQRIEAADIGK